MSVSGLASPSTRLSASHLTELIVVIINSVALLAATAATASPDHLISARDETGQCIRSTEYMH